MSKDKNMAEEFEAMETTDKKKNNHTQLLERLIQILTIKAHLP